MAGKGGRPPKITPELIAKVCNAIRGGAYVETAAVMSGVTKVTLYRWLKAGEKRPKSIHGQFCYAVEEAMAQAEFRDVAVVDKSAQAGDWRAAAWRLERKFPRKWGRLDRLEMTGKEGEPLVTEEQVKNMARAILGDNKK